MVALFCRCFRTFFTPDESRLRLMLYLHGGLDLAAAQAFWADVTGIPEAQFTRPYRAVPDPAIRSAKHANGCATITYSCASTPSRGHGPCGRAANLSKPFWGSSIGRASGC